MVGPPVLSSLFSAPSQCLAIVGRRGYLLVRDHGGWPAVYMLKCAVPGWTAGGQIALVACGDRHLVAGCLRSSQRGRLHLLC